ncbi:ceramidase domain-containing protein [Pseudochelatococcus lubricantis]|uniref:ceramidase domain-containing protein n=1 Tax=Pseudochelatococcus lubricantis TaxID=1538102 RepID=UPI0035EE9520
MHWMQAVDIYCERTGPGFWAEPVNAFSNAAFVLAGLVALHRARSDGADIWIRILCLWVAAIGVGSFLFHTFANRWSALADVLPIWSFVAVYVVFTLRRTFALGWPATGGVLAIGLAAIALVMRLLPDGIGERTNQSTQYLPAVLIFVAFAAAFAWSGRPGARLIVSAGLVFALSLFFRSVDLAACAHLPLGTHFLWHLLNATMLGLLLAVALRHRLPPPAA